MSTLTNNTVAKENRSITVYENAKLIAVNKGQDTQAGFTGIPQATFNELEARIHDHVDDERHWLRSARGPKGCRAIQILGHAGVLRTSDGTQIEVLPKTGKTTNDQDSRLALIEMIKALLGFRWYESQSAIIQLHRMPMLEVFIREFLMATRAVIKRGLRSDYITRQDNLMALRGRLIVARNITENLVRPDRFFTEHDEYSANRAENRLLHTALTRVISWSRSPNNQQLARELGFIFHEIPESTNIDQDFNRIRRDRDMQYYQPALQWAGLILKGYSPLTNDGDFGAPSLMFPMADLFEAYVEKMLKRKMAPGAQLTRQAKRKFLVKHKDQNWMQLKPDLVITSATGKKMVMDTKWKLLDVGKAGSRDKYGMSQADFYQLYAYAHYYVGGDGTLALVYPKTDQFDTPLEEFIFNEPANSMFRLLVLPFHLPTLSERYGYLVAKEDLEPILKPFCNLSVGSSSPQ
jgi:5-methylcytosine-specific restriction enzyme subunit McrC